MTILIVDDNKQNLYLLQAILQNDGDRVVSAANGVEALAKARQDPPGLIISDILMPVMDGFALCRDWKKDERLRSIPFIFYTATYTDERDREFALSLGAEQFLVKPMEPEVFLQTIREVIQQGRRLPAAPAGGPIEAPQENESGYLQQYNAVLIRKLEAKMQQLEQANRELDERVRQRTADLVAVNKTLDSFNYSVAHDLKAPLRAITGFAHILAEDYQDKIDDEGRRKIGIIGDNATKMGQLIDSLLALSHLNRQEMQAVDIDMKGLAQSACDELKASLFCDRNIEVTLKSLPHAWADLVLVKQAFMNLISNAMKFTSCKEKAVIEIGGYGKGAENVYYVKDNGVGFDMKYADKLFKVFQQLHVQDGFGGTGVGLAIVNNAVTRHGGTVWAEAEVDKGATFYFTLPKG